MGTKRWAWAGVVALGVAALLALGGCAAPTAEQGPLALAVPSGSYPGARVTNPENPAEQPPGAIQCPAPGTTVSCSPAYGGSGFPGATSAAPSELRVNAGEDGQRGDTPLGGTYYGVIP